MIKRYNIVEHSYGDGDTSMDVREDLEGQYVDYEDIKYLLQNTSPNNDYMKCLNDIWDIVSVNLRSGKWDKSEFGEILKKHFA